MKKKTAKIKNYQKQAFKKYWIKKKKKLFFSVKLLHKIVFTGKVIYIFHVNIYKVCKLHPMQCKQTPVRK